MCMAMKGVFKYLSPIAHLGEKKYTIQFPLFFTLFLAIGNELLTNRLIYNPSLNSILAIVVFIALITYFSFRNGIRGGIASVVITISYYLYIVFSRPSSLSDRILQLEMVLLLTILYLFLAFIVGGLKQIVDNLVETEANEKIRLQSIIQQLPLGVVITDDQGNVIKANKKSEQILGMKIPIGFPLAQKTLIDTFQNEKRINPTRGVIAQTLRNGKPISQRETFIIRKDGKKVLLRLNAAAIHNRHGKIIAAASIIQDITLEKENEKRKDDFVNIASHELKTPLTSMKLYLDLLQSRYDQRVQDRKTKELLTSVKYQTNRLQELVSDLLDVTRLQTGKLTYNKEEFNLNQLALESIRQLQTTTNHQKIIMTKSEEITVIADRFRIQQVLINLITNAIKYSPENSNISLQIKKKGDMALVSVKDKGIGVAKDQKKKIFERLYQAATTDDKKFPGLGMGLYISKQIIKRHRGKIWVESQEQKGSTFYFTLPIKSA